MNDDTLAWALRRAALNGDWMQAERLGRHFGGRLIIAALHRAIGRSAARWGMRRL